MKNYDLERKIYRYKTITKYQEKAKMLGYQDTSKVVFSFLNKRLLFTFLLFFNTFKDFYKSLPLLLSSSDSLKTRWHSRQKLPF